MTPTTLKAVRTLHNFSGVFLAPTILFFAITGGLQMFGLHETSRGSSYAPPGWLMHLSQLHKKGTLYLPPKRPGPTPGGAKTEGAPKADGTKATGGLPGAAAAATPAAVTVPAAKPPNPLPIKVFFAITAIGLVTSTITGVVMAWKYARRKSVVVGTLLAGVVVPLLLLLV